MRFMMIIKASEQSEAGQMPSEAQLSAMGAFNEEMAASGLLLGGEGLMASSEGARLTLSGGDDAEAAPVVVDGPFAESKELVAGFWLLKADSLEEVKGWAARVPTGGFETNLEIRRVFDPEDFGEEFTPELREREDALRKDLEG